MNLLDRYLKVKQEFDNISIQINRFKHGILISICLDGKIRIMRRENGITLNKEEIEWLVKQLNDIIR